MSGINERFFLERIEAHELLGEHNLARKIKEKYMSKSRAEILNKNIEKKPTRSKKVKKKVRSKRTTPGKTLKDIFRKFRHDLAAFFLEPDTQKKK